MKITKEEFEKSYAKNSNISVKKLKELGLFSVKCDCGDKMCKGWAMESKQHLEDLRKANL